MSKQENVDVLVIGGGGGAYPGAFRLAGAGYSVVMADPKGVLGGNCLYSGCVPSKTVREMSELISRARKLVGPLDFDFGKIQAHKDGVQEIRFRQHQDEIEESPGVTFYKGTVTLKGPAQAEIATEEGVVEVRARRTIVATGTEVSRAQFPGSEFCITSDDVFSYRPKLTKLPSELVIIGGGYIAFEVATMLGALGTKAHLLIRSDRALRGVDKRLVDSFLSALGGSVDIRFNSPILEVQRAGEGYRALFSEGGQKKELEADYVLEATGRHPVLPRGIEDLGLNLVKGYVQVDEAMQTNVKGVYAAGDVTGRTTYFHAAVRESLVAARNIMSGKPSDYLDVRSIPVSIFTFPPLAYVGITPEVAQGMGMQLLEASYPLKRDVMAQIFEERVGEVRIFVDKSNMRVVGGWVLGEEAPEVINLIALAAQAGLNIRALADFVGQHPVPFEDISYAARTLLRAPA